MLSLSTVTYFFGTSLLIAAAPGPDILFILTQSIAHGRKAGFLVALGNVSALLVPTVAAALGLSTLITSSPTAFLALRYVGAAYLVYLGLKAIGKTMVTPESDAVPVESDRRLALRGAFVSITNPHVTALFLAFIPQFVDATAGNVAGQVVQLGLLHMVSALLVFALVAIAAGAVRERIDRSPVILRNIDRITGVVFIGLALRLLL